MSRSYPEDWATRRRTVIERDEYECQNCGTGGQGTELHVHHVVPIAAGGGHEKSNLITLCSQCHHAAHGELRSCGTDADLEDDSSREVIDLPAIPDDRPHEIQTHDSVSDKPQRDPILQLLNVIETHIENSAAPDPPWPIRWVRWFRGSGEARG